MKRTPLERRSTPRRSAISPASPAQRLKCRNAPCTVCGTSPCDPAHVIDRSLLTEGQDDPRAVIPLCRRDHDLYDSRLLDLTPFWPNIRQELGFAVQRFGPVRTLERISGSRWWPERDIA